MEKLENLNLKRQLRKLVVPLFIEVALVMMLGAIDTVMLSQFSDQSVAAVGFDNQLISFIFLIYQFFSMGAGILCAQYLGACQKKRMVQVVGIALILNLLVGLGVSALLFLKAEDILVMMGLQPELLPEANIYLKITGALSFVQALTFTFSASLRSADRVVAPMVVTAIANVINIVGNYVLIFGKFGCPQMGVEGAAIATAISRVIALIIIAAIHFKTHIKRFPLQWFRPFPWSELKNLLHIGIPAMSEEISYSLSQIVIMLFINQMGAQSLAARTYCWNILLFVIIFCVAMTQGGNILVGHLVGAGKNRAAYLMGNYYFKLSLKVTIIFAVILACISQPIMRMLTEDEEIIRIAFWVFIIDCLLEFGRVANIFACGTLRAAGDAIYPVIVGIIFQWSVAVGCAYLFGIHWGWGVIGVWCAFTLDENCRSIVLLRRWNSLKWIGKNFAAK